MLQGSWNWFTTAGGNNDAITCDSYHYVERSAARTAPDSLFVAGCFAGQLAFNAQPNNATSNATLTLDAQSAFNAIYVACVAHNGTLRWVRALLGANIRDYSFAFNAVAQVDASDDERSAASGVLVLAFVQGEWRASALAAGAASADGCGARAPHVNATEYGFGGELGALFGALLDENGCVYWCASLASLVSVAGLALVRRSLTVRGLVQGCRCLHTVAHNQLVRICRNRVCVYVCLFLFYSFVECSTGVAALAVDRFAVYGTFSGTVNFDGAHAMTSSLGGTSADVFASVLLVEQVVVGDATALTASVWQYTAVRAAHVQRLVFALRLYALVARSSAFLRPRRSAPCAARYA